MSNYHKITIKTRDDQVLMPSTATILLDGKPLKGVQSVKLDLNILNRNATPIQLELIAELDAEFPAGETSIKVYDRLELLRALENLIKNSPEYALISESPIVREIATRLLEDNK